MRKQTSTAVVMEQAMIITGASNLNEVHEMVDFTLQQFPSVSHSLLLELRISAVGW